MFGSTTPLISVPIELIQCCFSAFESKSESEPLGIIGFGEWLNATAHRNPEQALPATELYLAHFSQTKTSLYDYENNLMQLLTRLFAEAEEREESDQGEMLRRVVAVQDSMLTLGLNGLDKWLGAAERP